MHHDSVDGARHYLSACIIVKDEGRYLLEWIAFHRIVGFNYFYIYDNDSSDETRALLEKLQDNGICHYMPWPRAAYPDNPQVHAYRHAIANFGEQTAWLAIIDADEFVVPLSTLRVDEILRTHFSAAASVLLNWRVFGSSGLKRFEDKPCIERFCRASGEGYHSNNHVKAICKPDQVDLAFVHNHFMRRGPVVLSDNSLLEDERAQRSPVPVYGHLRINHYYCKSLEEFMQKRDKGLAEYPLDHPTAIRPMAMFEDADRNEEEDLVAYRFLSQVVAEIEFLRTL